MSSQYHHWKTVVHEFFENPQTLTARFVHIGIIILILLSGVLFVIEHGYSDLYEKYYFVFQNIEWTIIGIFTIEYLLRLWSSQKRFHFFFQPFNSIDFLAVAPAYIGLFNTSWIRSLRLLRLLRLSRFFRIFRLFRYSKIVGSVFNLRNTIFEKILPIITLFTILKLCIYFLETNGYWLNDYNLETAFTVTGFALGIILSQKIGVAYEKFIKIEETITIVHGSLVTINSSLKEIHPNRKDSEILKEWVDTFHNILLRKMKKHEFYEINDKLSRELHAFMQHPEGNKGLLRIYAILNEGASFILNRMDIVTPRAYDQILHQATILYSFLLIIFLPGVSGIVFTFIATYVLYGMYQITNEMDNSMTHLENQLINADIHDLVMLKENLNGEKNPHA